MYFMRALRSSLLRPFGLYLLKHQLISFADPELITQGLREMVANLSRVLMLKCTYLTTTIQLGFANLKFAGPGLVLVFWAGFDIMCESRGSTSLRSKLVRSGSIFDLSNDAEKG